MDPRTKEKLTPLQNNVYNKTVDFVDIAPLVPSSEDNVSDNLQDKYKTNTRQIQDKHETIKVG